MRLERSVLLKSVGGALALSLSLALLLQFLHTTEYFIDEMYSIQLPFNFFAHLQYTPDIHLPFAGSFCPEMSIGIASNWPAGLAWLVTGSLSAVRFTSIFYHFALWTWLSLKLKESLQLDFPSTFAWMSFLLLSTLVNIPYAPSGLIQSLGELSGAILLALGFLYSTRKGWAGPFLLGISIWHTKFIYLPLGLAGILFLPSVDLSSPTKYLKELTARIAWFLTPLVAWIGLVWIRTGNGGLLTWIRSRISFFFNGNSGFNGQSTVTGIANRLSSDKLEWHFYPLNLKIKILLLLLVPVFILTARILRSGSETQGNARRFFARSAWSLSLLSTLVSYSVWYFFYHPQMWIRHLEPALLLGWAITLWELSRVTFFAQQSPSKYGRVAVAFLLLFTANGAVRSFQRFRLAENLPSQTKAEATLSHCRTNNATETGPMDILDCK